MESAVRPQPLYHPPEAGVEQDNNSAGLGRESDDEDMVPFAQDWAHGVARYTEDADSAASNASAPKAQMRVAIQSSTGSTTSTFGA